jgi:hypothetical protein
VTSKDREPGIHGRFTLKSKTTAPVQCDHWKSGRSPDSPARQFVFDIPNPPLLKPRLSVSILKHAFPAQSRLIRTPQNLSAEIPDEEADELDRLMKV